MRLNEATPLSSQATASPSMMQERERRRANVSTDQRKAVGEVIARTTIEPHSLVVLASNDAETVMFDFMQPLAARGQLVGFGWETRRDEPAATCELSKVGQWRLQLTKLTFFARSRLGHDALTEAGCRVVASPGPLLARRAGALTRSASCLICAVG